MHSDLPAHILSYVVFHLCSCIFDILCFRFYPSTFAPYLAFGIMHHPNVMIHACYIFFPRRTWTGITPSNGTWRLLCGSDKREYVGPMRLIGGSSPWVFIRSPVPLGKSSTCLARGPYCIPSGNSSRTGESFLLYKLRWAILLCMHRLSYGIIPHSSRSAQPGVQCWYEMRRAAQARRSVRSLATCHASTMRHSKLRDVAG